MKVIVIRFIGVIIMLSLFVYLINAPFKSGVYTIYYDTYEYSYVIKKQIIRSKNCEFTLRAYSKDDAVKMLIDIEYLNKLCVGDSVAIKNVVEL